MHYARRDLYDRTLPYRMIDAIKSNRAFAVDHVVQLGRYFVIVCPSSVDIDGMGPGGRLVGVFATNQAVAKPATRAFARRFALVADKLLDPCCRHDEPSLSRGPLLHFGAA